MVRLILCFLLITWLAPVHAQDGGALREIDHAEIVAGNSFNAAEGAAESGSTVPGSVGVTLPHSWGDDPHALPDQRWYSMSFDDAGWQWPAVYVERACTNLEVWVNGQRVGSGGAMTEPLTRNCYFPHLAAFPRSLLHRGTNRLDIRVVGYPQDYVASRQRAGGLSTVVIGEQTELVQKYESRTFWNITLAQVIGLCVLLIGLVIASLGWVRRQDRHNLYFGVALVLWAVHGTRLYWHDIPVSTHTSEIVYTAMYGPFALALLQFLLHYIGHPIRWVQQALWWQCGALVAALLWVPENHLWNAAFLLYVLLGCEFTVVMGYFARHTWRHSRHDFWFMGGNLGLLLLLTLAEIVIQSGWLALPKIHLLHFAMPVLSLAMGMRLVHQFTSALTDSERLNRDLEQRVAEKTAQVEHTYAQLSELRAGQAAAAERQRIASDLHDDLGAQLVTIAQASIHAGDMGRVAELARQALADMRLSVRGMTGEATPLAYVLADWRAETMERLTLANLAAFWNASDPPPQQMLLARQQVQLSRILREAVSNVIRHSRAAHCWVAIHVTPERMQIAIEDDGQGFDTSRASSGHGLGNLQARANSLQGTLQIGPREGGGTSIRVGVPLQDLGSAATQEPKGTNP